MKYLLISLFFFFFCSFIFTEDKLKTVKANIDSGNAILIDTRSKREWDKGHVKGARRFEVKDIRKMKEENELEKNIPKEKIIYTHCMAGVRAKIAADVLKERGYDVRPLKEGYPDLIKAGFQKE